MSVNIAKRVGLRDVSICRTCCKECVDYKSIFRVSDLCKEPITVATMLKYISGLDFVAEDNYLPTSVCATCIQNIAGCYQFKKLIIESDQFWRGVAAVEEIRDDEDEQEQEPEQEQDALDAQNELLDDEQYEADGLQSLATVAQIKRAMDNMEYVTMQVVNDDTIEVDVQEEDGHIVARYVQEDDNSAEEVLIVRDSDGEEMVVDEISNSHKFDANHDQDEQEQKQILASDDDRGSKQRGGRSERNQQSTGLVQETHELSEHEKDGDTRRERQRDSELREMEVVLVSADNSQDGITESSDSGQMPDRTRINRRRILEIVSAKKSLTGRALKSAARRSTSRHPDPNLQCKVCEKQLSNPNSFKYHMQLHSDATPFLCSLCGEGFKTRNAYDGHLATHDPNNPNTCEVCGKSYRQSSSLRTHMLTHTGEKPFQCDICGKGMTQKSGYKKHLLTHTGEKPHRCNICGREFRYSSNMLAHRRSHTGEKPHKCTKCGKRFNSTEQMKRHSLVHTQDRPFNCDLCNKSFKRRTSLAAHRNTHASVPERVEQKLSKSNIVEMY